jgi:outer membrane protein OmpA-like peptidoglycan-associated protein
MNRSVEAAKRGDYPAAAMTRTLILGFAASAILAIAPAFAQEQMYPGQGISVNPGAVSGGGYGSPYARAPYSNEVIHLHMPVVHHKPKPKPVATDVASAPPPAPVETDTAPSAPTPAPVAAPTPAPQSHSPYPPPLDSMTDTSTPTPPPAKPSKHSHVKEAAQPAPAAAPADTSTGQDGGIPLTLDPSNPHPVSQPAKPQKKAEVKKPAPPQQQPQQVATIDTDDDQPGPAPSTTVAPAPSEPASKGLSKRSAILFPRGVPDISSDNVDKMRAVAADLNTLLSAGAQRVQLDAYGGAPGDKGSDARRLALKRALGVRQLLIEDGIPSEKIDVRALGGISDGGAPDRVDVLIRS